MDKQPQEQSERLQLRIALYDRPAKDLEELMAVGNFRSLPEVAQHVINCYVGAMLDGLKESQDLVKKISGRAVLSEIELTSQNGHRERKSN